jgi:hypothetical protein
MIVIAVPSVVLGTVVVGDGGEGPVAWALIALITYLAAVVGIYFQVATVWAANEHFEGRDPTLSSSMSAANAHLGQIAGWAVLVTVIRLVGAFLRQRGSVGALAGGLLDALWAFASFLVVPAIVLAGLGPIDALKHSTASLRQTWGENIIGRVGLGALGFLAFLVVLPLFALAVWAVTQGSVVSALVVGVIAVVLLALAGVVTAVLSGVYQTALFRYAETGNTVGPFSGAQLAGGFRSR